MNIVDAQNATSIQMPPLARNLVDTNALAVMASWINSLPGIPALAPPAITPNGGTFLSSINVTLQPPDTNAVIYYSLDGTLPTTNSLLYTGAFNLTTNTLVSACAFETNFNNSVAASAQFFVEPVHFTGQYLLSGGQFQIGFAGLPGRTYVLQASTNFITWTPLITNLAATNLFILVDSNASNFPFRYYRVEQK
jgi:hypothetical protein